MAGLDEAKAREVLGAMLERLGRGPHAALGVAANADPEEVRGAFLGLTKVYHPARFGRMSSDLQRLANEVFLGIKGAHDTLRAPAMGRTSTSPGLAPIRPGSSAAPQITRPTTMGMPPIQRAPGTLPRLSTERLPANPARQTGGVPVVSPTRQTGPIPTTKPQTGPIPVMRAANPPPAPKPQTGPIPVMRATNPSPAPSVTSKTDRTLPIPAAVVPKTERTLPIPVTRIGPPPPSRPNSNTAPLDLQRRRPEPAKAPPPVPGRFPKSSPSEPFPRVDTTPGITSTGSRLDPSTTRPPAPSIAVAVELLAQRQWDAARVALSALSAMAPESHHVRALICFASGRQAQLEHRLDEARVDLQRALQLDPDLAIAKAALSELFLRRK